MMKKIPTLLMPAVAKLPFPRWSKDPWPMPSGLHEALPLQPALTAPQAARQQWEDEGGTVRPPLVAGPKLPL